MTETEPDVRYHLLKELCQVLGLDPVSTQKLVIEIDPNALVQVYVKSLLRVPVAKGLVTFIEAAACRVTDQADVIVEEKTPSDSKSSS